MRKKRRKRVSTACSKLDRHNQQNEKFSCMQFANAQKVNKSDTAHHNVTLKRDIYVCRCKYAKRQYKTSIAF